MLHFKFLLRKEHLPAQSKLIPSVNNSFLEGEIPKLILYIPTALEKTASTKQLTSHCLARPVGEIPTGQRVLLKVIF